MENEFVLTAVIIGKLTTALREWLAMNQQQVAIAQRAPDRKPETHTNSAHLPATFPSWKIRAVDRAGILGCSYQRIPVDMVGQHGFFELFYDHFGKQVIFFAPYGCGYNYQSFSLY